MVSILTFIIMIIVGAIILGFISVSAMFLIWWERKVSAHIQTRYGPMRVGWHGVLQPVADVIKLLLKEDIVPAGVDRWVWWFAPFFAVVPSVMVFACIPFGNIFGITLIPADLNIGILYILAITSVCTLGIFMAGWGSNNKYSLLGAMRAAAQMISYEIPLVLSIITVVMFAGSLSMQKIVEGQSKLWFVFQPNLAIAFIIYLISAVAETNRVPFDIPEAESELVAGFHTEYSGMKFAMFFLGEYTNLFIVSAIAATLFLGGWQGPFLPPVIWFLIKTYGIITVMMWFRWTFPRVRVDQLMGFTWKVLTPISFANLAVAGWVLLK
ncbi:MAG: NADH-quinone oxidoreductase subunit NuoH [Candidatus Omnitrophota bacterium]|nr:NADH-quinone oxidoreductase subunit NuoH [Candidatus Omnitrophota bacterium]